METIKHPKQVLAYNGEIIIFQISQLKETSNGKEQNVLQFSRKRFHVESEKFIETSYGQYGIQTHKSSIVFVCARCVTDVRTGIKHPYVLLKTCKRRQSGSSRLVLLQVLSSNEVEPCLKFKVDNESIEDLHLIDGPIVLWRQNEKIFYISSLTAEILTVPVNFSSIHWAGTVEDGTYILGAKNVRGEGDNLPRTSQPDRTLHGSDFVLYNIEKQKVMSGSCLVPHAYSSVLCCLEVCTMQCVNGTYQTSSVGASRKQLIWFENGVPKRVLKIPTENPSMLQVAYTSQAHTLCILSFASGDVCAIRRDELQITATWQHVGRTLVDDFVGSGSDQILLLFEDDPLHPAGQQAFRLTDCAEINYPVDTRDEKITESQYHENHLLMVQTLEARLQAGLLSLEEMENHLQIQDRVLQSSCEAFINMSLGKETTVHSAEEENLVSLWNDTEKSNYPSAEKHSSSVDPEKVVEKVWHRVVDDFLVIGVKVKDCTDLSLSDIGLSLIMDQEIALPSPVTKCQTNVLKLAISCSPGSSTLYHTEPIAKKQRLDYNSKDTLTGNCLQRPSPPSYQNDLEHTVTAVTELSSVLALNNTSCALLLHARRKTQPDCLLRSEKLSMPCGRIPLSLEDVLKGKHTINVFEHCQDVELKSLEDVFALLSVFQRCVLHIVSSDCTLTSLRVWLQNEMYAEPLNLMPEIMMCTRPGSLYGTLFSWIAKNPCEGKLTIFYRNNIVILQCLHSLKCILPPTCVVNVIRAGSKNNLARDLACSLEEELLAHRNLVSAAEAEVESELTLRCPTDNNISRTMESSDRKEQALKCREDLEMKKQQIKLGDNLTTNSELYRRSALRVAQLQLNSDSLICRIAKESNVHA
ncbi:Fanconi anemia group B protein [Lithobates pipiens]